MIIFNRVRYANFLSAGNAPIEVPLDTHGATLIVGTNGTGKSTVTEAICFALYGRPLRNVTKAKLVNSVNARDCLVELWLTINGSSYHIKRGIKPTIFEIRENGILIPCPAAIADYQSMLENNILKLGFKSFQQVVILGNASYVPFMRLTQSARRDLVENLLDIEVFGAMNALTKEEATSIKVDLEKTQQAKDLIGGQVKMAQTYHEHQEEERQQQVAAIDANIAQVEQTIEKLQADGRDLRADLAPYAMFQQAYDAATAKVAEYERLLATISARDKKTRKEKQFYDEHDTCPTCEQGISEEFKAGRYTALEKIEQDAAKAIVQCRSLIAKYQTQQAEAQEGLDQAAVLQKSIDAISAKISVHNLRIGELTRERAKVLAKQYPVATTADLEELTRKLEDVERQHAALVRRRVIVEAAAMLLRDNGIKAKVIRHYIPIINRNINHYLVALDFPIAFVLDEEFQESIKSRHRDDFAYDSFSEGEKKRIDLALLLTWRAVARMKNSASTNLLILDEVFDSSLDAAGTEEFLKVIAQLEADTNVFVISHKTDQLVDKFSHSLTFEKSKGFSCLKT